MPKHGPEQTIPNTRLKSLVAEHSVKEIACAFHKSTTAVSAWARGDIMPAYVGLMCEALERREAQTPSRLFLFEVEASEAEYVLETLKRLKLDVTEVGGTTT